MIVASNNVGKIKEIKEIFKDYEVFSLKDVGIDIDVLEDADTFYGNALKKAMELYKIAGMPVLADDSGLCISVYNDWPGVYTHRFIEGTDIDRNKYIINKMIDEDNRECAFITEIVYYDGINIIRGTGVLKGMIAKEIHGDNGFGFDSIFLLDNGKTLAEVSSSYKNKISPRYIALTEVIEKLKNY